MKSLPQTTSRERTPHVSSENKMHGDSRSQSPHVSFVGPGRVLECVSHQHWLRNQFSLSFFLQALWFISKPQLIVMMYYYVKRLTDSSFTNLSPPPTVFLHPTATRRIPTLLKGRCWNRMESSVVHVMCPAYIQSRKTECLSLESFHFPIDDA